jgi:hypothetical protein
MVSVNHPVNISGNKGSVSVNVPSAVRNVNTVQDAMARIKQALDRSPAGSAAVHKAVSDLNAWVQHASRHRVY